jgi:2-polyprenyl-3-methyl-5-hydroxy-6-metoxy-1,4-benzoquinol methylase
MLNNETQNISMKFTGEFFVPDEKYKKVSEDRELAIEHLQRHNTILSLVTGKDVLDIASGEGYGSSILASQAASVTGVDINEELVAHATATYGRNNLNFKTGNVVSIPLDNASMDIVVSFETLEHVNEKDQQNFLQEVTRVLEGNKTFFDLSERIIQLQNEVEELGAWGRRSADEVDQIRKVVAEQNKVRESNEKIIEEKTGVINQFNELMALRDKLHQDHENIIRVKNDIIAQLEQLLLLRDKLFQMSCEGEVSWYEFARTIWDNCKLSTPLHPASVKDFPLVVKRPFYSVLDNQISKKSELITCRSGKRR